MSPEPRVIPRSVQAEIVADLARGHRSTATIADRHHVPADLVLLLRDKYGPDLGHLSDAAEMLRRPALRDAAPQPVAVELAAEPTPEPAADETPDGPVAAPKKAWARYQDGLTSAERRACRAWAGLPVNHYPAPKDALARWDAAGRPMPTEAAWTTPAVVDVVDAPAIAASETDSELVENQEEAPQADLEPTADAPTPDAVELDDDFVAECVSCDTQLFAGRCPVCECPECGEPLDELLECPACTARRADDWDRFYGECLAIPELADQCKDVADAVERLRDARAEHVHREGMVRQIEMIILDAKNGLSGIDEAARAVLDFIEAA